MLCSMTVEDGVGEMGVWESRAWEREGESLAMGLDTLACVLGGEGDFSVNQTWEGVEEFAGGVRFPFDTTSEKVLVGASGEPHMDNGLLVGFGVEGWEREALGVRDGVVRSLLPLGAPASTPAEESPAEDGDDARVSTAPPMEDRAAAGPGAPDAGLLEPASGPPDAGRAAAAAAGSDGVGFDRLGGCLGSDFLLCTKTGGGFRGLEVVSLFSSLCSSGFFFFFAGAADMSKLPAFKTPH